METIKVTFHYENDEYDNSEIKYERSYNTDEYDSIIDGLVEICQDFCRGASYHDGFAYNIQNVGWVNARIKKPSENWQGWYLVTMKDDQVLPAYWLGTTFKEFSMNDIKAWCELPFGYGER